MKSRLAIAALPDVRLGIAFEANRLAGSVNVWALHWCLVLTVWWIDYGTPIGRPRMYARIGRFGGTRTTIPDLPPTPEAAVEQWRNRRVMMERGREAHVEALDELDQSIEALSSSWPEHPAGYQGPCLCGVCCSYADLDPETHDVAEGTEP